MDGGDLRGFNKIRYLLESCKTKHDIHLEFLYSVSSVDKIGARKGPQGVATFNPHSVPTLRPGGGDEL